VLEARAVADVLDALVTAWREAPQRLPVPLHTQGCEHLASAGRATGDATAAATRAAWFDAMLARSLAARDHDLLRRVAAAARQAGLPQADALRDAYAGLCVAAFTPPVPALWPRRTAGTRIRAAVLGMRGRWEDAQSLAASLSAMSDVVIALVDDDAAVVETAGHVGVMTLGRSPSADALRALAMRDVDVLVDLVGLAGPVGPLLAHRPARQVVAFEDDPCLPPPLTDAVLPGTARDAGAAESVLRGCARGTTDVDPRTAAELDALWQAAVAAHRAGDLALADDRYARVLAGQPGYAPALHLRGELALARGDAAAGRASLAEALVQAPAYHEARAAALAAAAAARDRAGVAALDAASESHAPPRLARAAGHAWLALRDGARAAARFEQALLREPTDGETHYNHGVALQMQHHGAEAARAYQRALTCRPDLVAADFNLGVLFAEGGHQVAAATAFEAVVRRDPAHVAAHKNLCESLLAAGQYAPWQQAFRRFEARCPESLSLAVVALEACHLGGDFAGVERYLEGLRKERFRAADEAELVDALEQLLFLLLYFDVEPAMLLRAAETYDQAAMQVYGAPLPRAERRQPGRIRLGYLSADLRDHVMGRMMAAVLPHHDRQRFDIRLYALSQRQDEWTARIAASADAFTSLAALDDAAAVGRIAADDLDILVDLGTHTRGARPGILARKPARVQVTHIASAGVVGMRAIDFKLTDAYADQPEAQETQLETLLPMGGCVYPYRHIEPAPTHPYHRAALGIPREAIVIGAFVNPAKLSRRCLVLWRDVLQRLPEARLALSPLNAGMREAYLRLAAAGSIDAARLLFMPAGTNEGQNQARYAVVDFVLDPMPYGGVNGTLEALDAGVPVVTLVGARHGERAAYSILANLGVPQTVAHSGREYVEIAVRLARDAPFRAEVRDAIRAGLAHSPLVDMAAHTRNLEAAYLHALEVTAAAR
jgi:predicted O-linked N-acetylglucosamine transferase (SPINDLY family)